RALRPPRARHPPRPGRQPPGQGHPHHPHHRGDEAMTDTTRPRLAVDALTARIARTRATAPDDSGVDPDVLTRPVLEALAERVAAQATAAQVAGSVHALVRVDDVAALASLALAAARHGYPRPPLEQLGQQAATIPTARTGDPSTSQEAGEH